MTFVIDKEGKNNKVFPFIERNVDNLRITVETVFLKKKKIKFLPGQQVLDKGSRVTICTSTFVRDNGFMGQ